MSAPELLVYVALFVASSTWLPLLAWRFERGLPPLESLPDRPAFRGSAPLALPAAHVAEPVDERVLELVG